MIPNVITRAASVAAMTALALVAACSDTNDPTAEPPPAPVASVAVSPPTHSLRVGQQVTLQARPKATDGSDLERAVTWASENETLATVSAQGVVTTLAVGEVGIRATSEGKFGRAVIAIQPVPPVPVAEVRLSVDDEIVLEWDGSLTITARAFDAEGNEVADRQVQWMSSKPSIAAVSSGKIEARNPGVATITAVIDGIPASVGVRVKQAPVVEVFIDAGTTGLEVGETFIFGSRLKRADGEVLSGPASWTSSAPAVARVEHEDLWYATIEALAEGTFTLTATVEGVSTSMTLRVTARPTYDLVYNRYVDAGAEILTLDLGTAGASPVKINAGNVSYSPSPSPDGTQLVFAVSQRTPTGDMQNDLYIVNRNGTNMRWLTRTPGLENQPKWSPDGAKILFHGRDNRSDLFVINPDGTGLRNVTATIPDEMTDKSSPAWSPDGSRIAFIGSVGGQHKVWMIDADGSNPRPVTTDVGFDMMPAFSPDGRQIAFVRYDVTTPANGDDIMIVSAQGGTPVRLSLPGDQRSPAWSPDGRYIAVSGKVVGSQGVEQLFTMRPDGSGLRLRTVNPAWGGGGAPAWIARQ